MGSGVWWIIQSSAGPIVMSGNLSAIRREQQATGRDPASDGDRGHLRTGDLTGTRSTAQLGDGLDEEAEPVAAPGRELAAVRVHRQGAAGPDAFRVLHEVSGLAQPAETERLQPRDCVEAESVVQAGDVDVIRGQVGA